MTSFASPSAPDDPRDRLLYVARVAVSGAKAPEPHAIYGTVFEPEIRQLAPQPVAAGLGEGRVSVRALDQLVAALAGCLTGTLQGALAGRHVRSDNLTALVEGRIVQRDGVVRLAAVHARYTLPVQPQQQAAAERALAVHERACPASRSVQPAIAVSWEATFVSPLRADDEPAADSADQHP